MIWCFLIINTEQGRRQEAGGRGGGGAAGEQQGPIKIGVSEALTAALKA